MILIELTHFTENKQTIEKDFHVLMKYRKITEFNGKSWCKQEQFITIGSVILIYQI